MYFWNIDKLKSDFKEGLVTEKSILHYLIAYTILVGIALIPFGDTNQFDVLTAISLIPVSIIGIQYAYASNNGEQGSDFLAKYFAIGWVISVRFIAAIIPLMFVIGLTFAVFNLEYSESSTIWHTLFEVIVSAFLFWRIAVHIKQTTVTTNS